LQRKVGAHRGSLDDTRDDGEQSNYNVSFSLIKDGNELLKTVAFMMKDQLQGKC
jgi:hypothetical protein